MAACQFGFSCGVLDIPGIIGGSFACGGASSGLRSTRRVFMQLRQVCIAVRIVIPFLLFVNSH
jgi:hypothetical protein